MLKFFSLLLINLLLYMPLHAGTENMDPSPLLDFIWKTLNVLVLVAIIYKFAKNPVKNALTNNAKSAKELIYEAREAEKKVSNSLTQMKSKISNLEKEALKMVEKAKIEAEDEKSRIIEEGKKEIQRMTEQANFVMQQERRKAEHELKNWVAEECVKLAEKNLKNEMNQNNQKNLVGNYMKQLEKQKELF